MSANNWTICPKCKKKTKDLHAQRLEQAQKSYGVVPADEYEQLIAVARKPIEEEETLREDYEVGICDNLFEMVYSASCDKCGFSYKHSLKELIYVK